MNGGNAGFRPGNVMPPVPPQPQPEPEETPEDWHNRETARILRRRRDEALQNGMSLVEARLFAESDINIGDLRHLVKSHCPGDMLARILL